MHPDEEKAIGRVVGVLHADEAVQGSVRIIEGDIDVIIDLLLPVGFGRGERGGDERLCRSQEWAGEGGEEEEDGFFHD
jgi:hypothetical protein